MAESSGQPNQSEEKKTHTGRKLYLVPLVRDMKDAPEGFKEKLEAFWREVGEHLYKIETRFGHIRKIYHESVPAGGEEGLKFIEQANAPAHRLIDRKMKMGAVLVSIEDAENLGEVYDWALCLQVVGTPAVRRKVQEFWHQAITRRMQIMQQRLDEDLADNEAALLIISPEHGLQFPPDIQVFYISPPSLDDIQRLLREHAAKRQDEEANQAMQ